MKKYILFLIFVPFLIINGCDDNEEVMGGIDLLVMLSVYHL